MGDTVASLDKGPVGVTNNIASNASGTNDPVPEDSAGISRETVSEDPIVCIEEEEEFRLPELPPELSTLVPATENSSNSKNEDEDFSIVYEKISPQSEVQIVISRAGISKSLKPKKAKRQGNTQLFECSDNGSVIVNEQNNSEPPTPNALDDSVCIVGEFEAPRISPHIKLNLRFAPIAENLSTLSNIPDLNVVQRPAPGSLERKKRKIECGVCFDGPDEITLSGHTVISTVCGHIFCDNCIKLAIKNTRQCPQCRKRLNNKQYHPIYI